MAQPIPSQGSHDSMKRIKDWQSQQQIIQPSSHADEALEHDEISRLSAHLLSLFKEVILTLKEQATVPKDALISLERSCSSFILWSDGYGIAQGQLNDVFKKSSKLRYTLFTNLSHLGNVLTERLIPLADISSEKLQQLCSNVESSIHNGSNIINEQLYQRSDDSSSDAESTFSNDNIYEVAEDLKTDTCVLSSLDPLIKYPILDLEKGKAVENYVHSTLSPEKSFIDKIEHRFPLADVSLASRLGKSNYERYLRCQEDREALENEGNEEDLPSTQQEDTSTVIAKSKFHDSGVGTSIAPTTNYAETLMSYSHKGRSVCIPPLPKGAKEGMPFSCIACNRTVAITNNSAWKRHIYLDLQPYMCLDVSCSYSNTPFKKREQWISHLALEHEMEPKWDSINCLLCKKETGSGKVAVTRHFSEHLEEISLSALPREVNSNVTSKNGSEMSDSDSISTIEYPEKPSPSSLLCEASSAYCSKTFRTFKERYRHYRAEHRRWADDHGILDLCYSCEACGRTFTRPDNKRRHLKEFPECHERIQQLENAIWNGPSPFTDVAQTYPPFPSSFDLPNLEASFMRDFKCCGKILPNLHDLLQHYEEAHGQISRDLLAELPHEFDHSSRTWLYNNPETQENPSELKQAVAELGPLQSQSLPPLPQAEPLKSFDVAAHDTFDSIHGSGASNDRPRLGVRGSTTSSVDIASLLRIPTPSESTVSHARQLRQEFRPDPPSNALMETPVDMPPPATGWTPEFDHSTQRWLYNNTETGVTQREVPLVNSPFEDGISSAFSSSDHADEDWTKISDLAERRRIQNRIAQRSYREKLKRRLEDLERRAESKEGEAEKQPSPSSKLAASLNNLNPGHQRRYNSDQEIERTQLGTRRPSQAAPRDVVGQTAQEAKEQAVSGVEE